MTTPSNPRYWLSKRARRKTGYPLATIAYYGPDATSATKVVVGILPSAQQTEVEPLQTWHGADHDLRTDDTVLGEILAFLDQHQVARVVMLDRIIGCPHQEGIDYPEGEACPQCTYWMDRDRWTGERLSQRT